jgi:hypothetical protein
VTVALWIIFGILLAVTVIGFVTLFTRVRVLERTVAKQGEHLDRVTDYAKEIDPRFDDERRLIAELQDSVEKHIPGFAGMSHMELVKEKKARGERTLLDPI